MKKGLYVLAGLAVLAAMTVPALAADDEGGEVKVKPAQGKEKAAKEKVVKEKAPKEKDDALPGAAAAGAFGDDLEQLSSAVTLTDEQKTKLQKIKEARDKALEKHDKTAEKTRELIESRRKKLEGKDKNSPEIKMATERLAKQEAALETERNAVAEGFEKRMFAILTPEQRAKWNTPILKDEVMKEFSLVFLEDTQGEKIQGMCETFAKRLTAPVDPVRNPKAIDPLKAQVFRTVLTKKQQADYKKAKTPLNGKDVDKPHGGKEKGL